MTNNVEELIVLGNGFDLQCELKTNYWNFFSYTLRNLEEFQEYKDDETIEPITYFENNIRECLEFKFIDFEEIIISGDDFSRIPKNLWYQIFLYEKNNQNTQWNQIESQLLTYLKYKDVSDRGLAGNLVTALLKILRFNGIYKDIVKTVQEYIKNSRDNRLYILLIWTIKEKEDVFSNKIKSFINGENLTREELEENLTNILLSDLKQVEDDFIDFIKYKVNNSSAYHANSKDLLSGILGKDVYTEKVKYNLLTFNYTYPFFQDFVSPNLSLSVHGKALVHGRYNEVIFGIDHSDIELDSFAYRFTKNYRTLQLYSTNPEYENYPNVYEGINKIKFYGHSLAEADYSYFQQMFDYYDLYSNNDLQLIFYYSKYKGKTIEEIRQEQFNSISKLISTYGATLDNKDKGNNLLTRLMQTGRLRLKQI